MKENQDWLRARGIHFKQKNNAAMLSMKVASYLTADEVPDILEKSSYAANDVQDLIYHASEMIKLIMKREVNDDYYLSLEHSIKVFFNKI